MERVRLNIRLTAPLVGVALLAAACGGGGPPQDSTFLPVPKPVGPAKNVIFMMGDGMGKRQVEAGRIFKAGPNGQLTWEAMSDGPPASVKTFSLTTTARGDGGLTDNFEATDSAAAATAFATGRKVENGNVGVLPTGEDLLSILELAQKYGKSTGLITTSFVTDASPAAFFAESTTRYDDATIVNDLIQKTLPNVVMGGGLRTWNTAGALDQARYVGYTVVDDATDLAMINPAALPDRLPTGPGLIGIFPGSLRPYEPDLDTLRGLEDLGRFIDGNEFLRSLADLLLGPDRSVASLLDFINGFLGESLSMQLERDTTDNPEVLRDPSLPAMVEKALGVLERNPDGFFLFVENEHIDSLGHVAGVLDAAEQQRLTGYMVREVAALDEAFEVVNDWVERRGLDDTLVILGADHECGGFDFDPKEGEEPYVPGDVVSGRFTSTSLHTNDDVWYWAMGPGSDRVLAATELKDLYFAMQWAYTRYDGLLFPEDFIDNFDGRCCGPKPPSEAP